MLIFSTRVFLLLSFLSEFEKKKEEILNEVEQKKIEDQRRQDLFDHHHQMIGVHCPDGQLPSSLQCLDIEEGDGNDDRPKMTRSIFACDDDAFEGAQAARQDRCRDEPSLLRRGRLRYEDRRSTSRIFSISSAP